MMNNDERMAKIEELINGTLNPIVLEVIDDSDEHIGHAGATSGAGHFTVKIQCNEFNDRPLIECHRVIYGALTSMIPSEIHALKIDVVKK